MIISLKYLVIIFFKTFHVKFIFYSYLSVTIIIGVIYMKRISSIILSGLVLFFITNFFMNQIASPSIDELEVSCSGVYLVESNEYDLTCEVEDAYSLINEENRIEVSLFQNGVLFKQIYSETSLDISHIFTGIEDDSNIEILVQLEDNTIQYYQDVFLTESEEYTVPLVSVSSVETTDTSLEVLISYNDVEDRLIEAVIQLRNEYGTVISTRTYRSFTDATIKYNDLSQQQDFTIEVILTFKYNLNNDTTQTITSHEFTTLKTYLHPEVVISNVNIELDVLTLDVATIQNDAVLDEYYVIIKDSQNVYHEVPLQPEMEFDISLIYGDFEIQVIGTYTLDDRTYTDWHLEHYPVIRDYANFFVLPDLYYVDTTSEISSYEDFVLYAYTYIDQGETDFTIYCAEILDCSTFVTTDYYGDYLFYISNVVHSYYSFDHISYTYNSDYVQISVTRSYTSSDIIALNEAVQNVLESIITPTMTDEEKILAVHDYVVNNTVYDSDCLYDFETCDTDHVAQGVLFDGNAVCEGYANAVDIMLRSLGIPSIRVISETHMWNAIYINDQWLHLDATWDDPVTQNGQNILSHTYYLIDSAQLAIEDTTINHEFNTEFYNYID